MSHPACVAGGSTRRAAVPGWAYKAGIEHAPRWAIRRVAACPRCGPEAVAPSNDDDAAASR